MLYRRGRLQQATAIFHLLYQKLLTVDIFRLGRLTVRKWLKRHNLDGDHDFIRFLDAQLLISAQTTSSSCNALYAAMALDLPRKYPCSIMGGVGTIAKMLSGKVKDVGGRVHCKEKVLSLTVDQGCIKEVVTGRGRYRGRQIVLNASSAELAALLNVELPATWQQSSRTRWGAFVLHLGANDRIMEGLDALHLQLVNSTGSLAEGESLFLSASHPSDRVRAVEGKVALSVSTHTAVKPWWDAYNKGNGAYATLKEHYIEKMYTLLGKHIQDFSANVELCMAGTPVTYNRFTGRHLGLVGGYSQKCVLPPAKHYFGIRNCTFVGDFSFPGQSMAAVTVGAALVADRIGRKVQ